MKIKWLSTWFAVLGAVMLCAAEPDADYYKNLTVHFVIDYSKSMQDVKRGHDGKSLGEECFANFLSQMEALQSDPRFSSMRYEYETLLQRAPKYVDKEKGKDEWYSSVSAEDQSNLPSGAIKSFNREKWGRDLTKMLQYGHLDPYRYNPGEAAETSDWNAYILRIREKPGIVGENTLCIFFVYEAPSARAIQELNRFLMKERHSQCRFIAMRKDGANTANPASEVQAGFDFIRNQLNDAAGTGARIDVIGGTGYPGDYTFRINGLPADFSAIVRIDWRLRVNGAVVKEYLQSDYEPQMKLTLPLESDAAAPRRYTVEAMLTFFSTRVITLKKDVEVKAPVYEFSVQVNGKSYRDGGKIQLQSAEAVPAVFVCRVIPEADRKNLEIEIIPEGGSGTTLAANPENRSSLNAGRGRIVLRDTRRQKDAARIAYDIGKPEAAAKTEPKQAEAAAKTEPKQAEAAAKPEPKKTEAAAKPEPKKPEPKKEGAEQLQPLTIERFTVNGKEIKPDINDVYGISIPATQEKAAVDLKLNRPARKVEKGAGSSPERTSWMEELPAGEQTIRFRADDGKSLDVKIKVKIAEPVAIDPYVDDSEGGDWWWIVLAVAAVAVIAGLIVLKKVAGGKIFEMSFAVGQKEYQKLERPFGPGRHRIDESVFEGCLGEFTIILSQEKSDDDVLQKLVFELPQGWSLATGYRSCGLNNGVSETFIIGRDEYILTTPKGMMKVKITIMEK